MNRLSDRLLAWYDHYGRRDLPWQRERSPYHVWVSEIMLQQTQVATVIPYFERFVARFPDVAALATAPLDDVLHHWSGLGYYARARNLQRAARRVVAEHAGVLPSTAEDLLALPGIGRSTAGAIRALGFGQRAAILDGNVKRVLTRHHAVAGWPDAPAVQRTLWQLAEEHTPVVRVADYTQAIMDLGATLCTRAQPRCGDCPLRETCAARRADAVANYPAPRPRRALPVRATHFLVLVDTHGAVLLERRPPNGVWGGLWSFPELSDVAEHYAWCAERGLVPQGTMRALPVLEHGFTHFKLTITPWCETVTMRGATCMDSDRWLWYNAAAPARIGLAKPVATILSALSTAPS